MYLKRKIDSFLDAWRKQSDRKPLIVKGARQIGKSESIRHFAKKNYKHLIEINFVSEPHFKSIVDGGYNVESIVKNLSLLKPEAVFEDGETLLFFDEIQDFPEIATSLKFFKIDGRYDVICSGSMLGVNYKHINSISVGYKTDYEMFSMDFREFLWAKGYDDALLQDMEDHIVSHTPFSDIQHNLMIEIFRDFCVVGGMPEIVSYYITNKTFEGVLGLQRQLMTDYRDEVRKYVNGIDQTRILNVLNHIAVQLEKENKKFQISKVAHDARTRDYWGCIEWLAQAGIINICYCLNFPELPLKGNYDETKYKLYFADTGLLISELDDESQYDLRANRNLGTYKGAIFENVVADAFRKNDIPLYYYKRNDSSLEEDFFIRTPTKLVPVEVKASKGQSQSLRTLISSNKYADISWGIKLSLNNIGYANNILTIPYYCAFLLKNVMTKL